MKLLNTCFKKQPNRRAPALPQKGVSAGKIRAELLAVAKELGNTDVSTKIGWLHIPPHKASAEAYRTLLPYNPNNIGNWSLPKPRAYTTQKLEKDVMDSAVSLYNTSKRCVGGYLTSGTTESILYSLWLLKTWAHSQKQSPSCVIGTSLTHYSARKSAQIVGLPFLETPVDSKTLAMHPRGLSRTLENLAGRGLNTAIVLCTLGYTQTGGNDSLEEVNKIITLATARNHHTIYGVVDAAINGVFLPYITSMFFPFQYPWVQSFATDYHKMGLVPYPAGIVLLRRPLFGGVIQKIPYLQVDDATLLGSRPGVAAAATWSVMRAMGKNGFSDLYKSVYRTRLRFLSEYMAKYPQAKVIADQASLSCAVAVPQKAPNRSVAPIEKKYGFCAKPTRVLIYPDAVKMLRMFTIHFLPHIPWNTYASFINDFSQLVL